MSEHSAGDRHHLVLTKHGQKLLYCSTCVFDWLATANHQPADERSTATPKPIGVIATSDGNNNVRFSNTPHHSLPLLSQQALRRRRRRLKKASLEDRPKTNVIASAVQNDQECRRFYQRPTSSSFCSSLAVLTFYYILSVFLNFFKICLAVDPLVETSTNHYHHHHRRRRALTSQQYQQQPIFRSAEYIFAAPNSVYDLPGDASSKEQSYVTTSINLAINRPSGPSTVLPTSETILLNSTEIYVKQPPVVWVPYLGVIVILAVFSVLITTFWLHIRRSRYRAIQLVKSSPNSEWNEIQPGRWEASYGGHVYSVNQITQTRVLGAIAAAAAAAMGQGFGRATSNNRLLLPLDEETGASEPQTMADQSSNYNNNNNVSEVDADADEHTGLLYSQASQRSSTRSSGKTRMASVQMANSRPCQQQPVPVSDSIWLLTEDQLMESIHSKSSSSEPVPSPMTATTAVTPGYERTSTSTVTSAKSGERVPNPYFPRRSAPPPPVPPRQYGTFTRAASVTSPVTYEATASRPIDLTASNRPQTGHQRASLQKSLPLSTGENIPLETLVSPRSASSTPRQHYQPDLMSSSETALLESDDVCGELLPHQGEVNRGADVSWINQSFCDDEPFYGAGPTSPTSPFGQLLSLDDMKLPEPEPWSPPANHAGFAAAQLPIQRVSSQAGNRQIHRNSGSSGSAATLSQGQSGSGQGSSAGGTNMIQNRRVAVRGSLRGRGRGAAGRGQLSSLMTYSNMSKKKGGFIIPRG